MPKAAIELGVVDDVLHIADMGQRITQLLAR
jgi:chemotaxis response regulator CheB